MSFHANFYSKTDFNKDFGDMFKIFFATQYNMDCIVVTLEHLLLPYLYKNFKATAFVLLNALISGTIGLN